mmetsp:Transcript_14335/g.30711  ORF Transcript_14335/g.30711 Transcript_14335/m.30711 type:complete len:369 (-) Transcript_14335:229-1335(-)|eukprot:CAMPEP_0118934162 /NCGR_PEP_ID=MMETSP1169-20130426/13672_1 /TAXON_ID=36882 /ORGANISM="Pyramimonas obovata, Strain CCMP722" /LENGTH=368 /DNA_ID=CAMNT_0006877033 /DNA_START=131 /DNA_END=1237 /DNA_ORIENTATION=+
MVKKTNKPADSAGSKDDRTIGEQTSYIKNKQRRSEILGKLKHKKKQQKRADKEKRAAAAAKAIELGELPAPKKIPRTIENTRERDATTVEVGDEEVEADEAEDEFADHFNGLVTPKVLLTTSDHPSAIMFHFLQDMLRLMPNATYYKRGGYELKKICEYASAREFTHVVVFNENRKQVNGMVVTYLPYGPTAHFRISNMVLSKKIKNHGRPTRHRPELILNNFTTRLGHRVGRLLATMWPHNPEFRGRRAVTFHNQRDFVFFRHHRYIFETNEDGKERKEHKGHLAKQEDTPRLTKDAKYKQTSKKKKKEAQAASAGKVAVSARLQELGPRFCLRLQSLQRGTFNTKSGEYEWIRQNGKSVTRKKFVL